MSNAHRQANHVSNSLVLQRHYNSAAHDEHESDLLNVELYYDNLKMFNQAWEETLLSRFGNDLDEHVLRHINCPRGK